MGQPSEFMKIEDSENSWLGLVAEKYGVTLQNEPLLLNERDGQRVYRVDTLEAGPLTLRLCTPARRFERVLADTQVLLFLERAGFPAPALRPTLEGEPLFSWQPDAWAYAQEFIEGQSPELNLTFLHDMAGLVGRLHTLASSKEAYPTQVKWLTELPVAIKRAVSAFNNPEWGAKAKEVAAIMAELPDLSGLPEGITHTDVHEGNFLRGKDGKFYMLDWEDGGWGELILDIALALGWLCVSPASKNLSGQITRYDFDKEWCTTFLKAYQQFRPISPAEAQKLGAAVRFVIGWYAARDITREIANPGSTEGLAWIHWAIVRSVTPMWDKALAQWAEDTRPETA